MKKILFGAVIIFIILLIFVFASLDTNPPVISNIQVSNITANSAKITWHTDEDSTSIVEYGIATGSYDFIASGATTATGTEYYHQVNLSDLASSTTYYYKVSSTDNNGNKAESEDKTFTIPSSDILDIQVSNITETFAIISWITYSDSDSVVEYGYTTGSYEFVASWEEVLSADRPEGEINKRNIATCKCLGDLEREAEFLRLEHNEMGRKYREGEITEEEFRTFQNGEWDTEYKKILGEIANIRNEIGYSSGTPMPIEVYIHAVRLCYLNPETTYHYKVNSTDSSGNTVESEDRTFLTLP